MHLQHGPIDLVIAAEGQRDAVAHAHAQAWRRFEGLLAELVGELPALRSAVGDVCPLRGPVARRMWHACAPYRWPFITPMAAVAGAVADDIVAHYRIPGITRALVNNGGDIAVHLTAGQDVTLGIYADLAQWSPADLLDGLAVDGRLHIHSDMPVRGVATSGWRGRSQSLGIADSVTVLADTAASADAAATVIANAVNVEHPGIARRPAWEVKDDSDLGDLLVTVGVAPLPLHQVHVALENGRKKAQELLAGGLIQFAVLTCQRNSMTTSGFHSAPLGLSPPKLHLCAEVGSVFA